MTSSSHKDVPEYDENITCENPECKHIEANTITGLYGMAGGGGVGVYSVCEHCGAVLSKTVDDNAVCDTQDIGSKAGEENVEGNTEPRTDLDK